MLQSTSIAFISAVPEVTKHQSNRLEDEKIVASAASSDGKKWMATSEIISKNGGSMPSVYLAQGHNGQALVEAAMSRLGWTKTTDKTVDNWKLSWTETKGMVNYGTFREGQQLVNHIPNCEIICNKLGLLTSLREFERVSVSMNSRQLTMQLTDFFPETYVLDYPREREAFFEAFKPGEIWINKPTGLNQGKGIFLVRDIAQFREALQQKEEKKVASPGNPIKAGKSMGRIVQRYIMNPLLIYGRKFDIRAYLLIGSTAPYLVLFHHGYLRLSIHKYDADDANLCTHLTNQYIQKKDEKYEEVKNDTVWSMSQFNDYLNSLLKSEGGIVRSEKIAPPPPEKDWVFNGMEKQMKAILLHMFNAVKHKLTTRLGYFELYGIDFMIDDNYKLFLIEVNTNPAMHVNCQLLNNLLPPLIEGTIHIALECFNKAKKRLQLLPLKSLGNFQVLYCGTVAAQSQSGSLPTRQPQHRAGSPQVLRASAQTSRQQRPQASPTMRRKATTPNVLASTVAAASNLQPGPGSVQDRQESFMRRSRVLVQRSQRHSQSQLQPQPQSLPVMDEPSNTDGGHMQQRQENISSSPSILLSYQPIKTPSQRVAAQWRGEKGPFSDTKKLSADSRPARLRPIFDRSS